MSAARVLRRDLSAVARELRHTAVLADPRRLVAALGREKGAQRQSSGVTILCPWHGERSPSCSVTRGPDGTVRAKCFSCDATGDALALVAVAHGLDLRHDFRLVLVEAARLSGEWSLVRELDDGEAPSGAPVPVQLVPPLPPPEPVEERVYPPDAADVWARCGAVVEDDGACAYLSGRGLDGDAVADRDLARVLPAPAPRWATFHGSTWLDTGHRLVLPVFDATGVLRSVRAMRVVEGDSPKRLPPAGHKAAGLVLADPLARLVLERGAAPEWWPASTPLRLVVVEGEPDFLTWATRFSDANETAPGVIGVGSGAWSKGLADRIPDRARVIVRTHDDRAGQKYAAEVIDTLGARCDVRVPKGAS